MLHLNVPAGTPALFMESTYYRYEGTPPLRDITQELLLGRDTRYVIDDAVEIAGRWHSTATSSPTDAGVRPAGRRNSPDRRRRRP